MSYSPRITSVADKPKVIGILFVILVCMAALVVVPLANAAISFRSATGANNGGGASSITINTPTGATVGDVLVLTIDGRATSSGTGPCLNTSNVFSLVERTTHASMNLYKATYYKVLTSTPPSSYTIDLCDGLVSQSHKASAGLIAYSGVDTASPINVYGVDQGSDAVANSTGVTTTVAGTRLLVLVGEATSTTCDPDNSLTERYETVTTGQGATSRTTSCGADKVLSSSGGSSTSSITLGAAADHIVHTVALRPSASLEQSGFRWFANADSTSPGSALAAQNVMPTGFSGQHARLQMLVDQSEVGANSTDAYRLQYAVRGSDGVCDAAPDDESYQYVAPDVANVAKDPGTVANDSSVGSTAWVDPDNARVNDNSTAYVNLAFDATTYDLKTTNYGYTIPSTATITGIELWSDMEDMDNVALRRLTKASGTSHNSTTADRFPTGYRVQGSSTDLWGTSWAPADINDSGFGARVSAFNDIDPFGVSVGVDHIQIRVYYTEPSGDEVTYYNNSAPVDSAPAINGGLTSARTIKTQSYEENNSNMVRAANLANAGETALWDFSLDFRNASNSYYCFRLVKADGSELNGYIQMPAIEIAQTMEQGSYRWYANADSLTPGTPLASQNGPASIATEIPFRLRQLLARSSGSLAAGQDFRLQYALRSGVCDTSFSGETYVDFDAGAQDTGLQVTATNASSFPGNATGLIPWGSSTNVLTDDGAKASTSTTITSSTQTSYTLSANGYGLAVPSGATIEGVEVVVDASGGGGGSSYIDVRLDKNSGTSSTTRSGSTNLVSESGSLFTYGSSTDMWGLSLTPSEVNDASFAVHLEARLRASTEVGQADAYVDYAAVRVYYSVPSGGDVIYHDNASVTDEASISQYLDDPTPAQGSTVYQSYNESGFVASSNSIDSGDSGLWDFSIIGTVAASGNTYCFRMVASDGSPLTSYSNIPEITFSSGGTPAEPTLVQQMRGGQAVVDGIKSPFSW